MISRSLQSHLHSKCSYIITNGCARVLQVSAAIPLPVNFNEGRLPSQRDAQQSSTPIQTSTPQPGTPNQKHTPQPGTPNLKNTPQPGMPNQKNTPQPRTPNRKNTPQPRTPNRKNTPQPRTPNQKCMPQPGTPNQTSTPQTRTPNQTDTQQSTSLQQSATAPESEVICIDEETVPAVSEPNPRPQLVMAARTDTSHSRPLPSSESQAARLISSASDIHIPSIQPREQIDQQPAAPANQSSRTDGQQTAMELDEDQKAVLDCWEDEKIIINAGPGAGKTLTLCKLIERIFDSRSSSRVLALAFNRYAVAEIKARLLSYGVQLISVENVLSTKDPGCLVSTFDSFGHQVSGKSAEDLKDSTYDDELADNTERLRTRPRDCTARTWDWLIVDEAQDINRTRADLVKTLMETCKHYVVAGDPRQSMDKNITWFSDLWRGQQDKEFKMELKYNHRSRPELVKFLNDYSRYNFSKCGLHIEQIPRRAGSADFEVLQVGRENYGKAVGHRLILSAPEEAYAITPVTLYKYDNETVTKSIQDTVTNLTGCATHLVLRSTDSDINSRAYKIGTVLSLKGTEKNRVVVYGIARSYSPKVNNDLLAKRIYVAISRAKDSLHLMLNKELRDDSPLKPFEKIPVVTKQNELHRQWNPNLWVTDLANERYRYWSKDFISGAYRGHYQNQVPHRGVSVDPDEDCDFVGLYLESVLAHCLGFEISDSEVERILSQAEKVEDNLVCGDDGKAKPASKGLPIAELRRQFKAGQAINPCYALARAQRSLKDGKMYRKSSRLERCWEKHKEECRPFADFILCHLSSPRAYQQCYQQVIKSHRSSKTVGTLVGVADFAGHESVVEVKHVSEIRQEHRMQTAMYAAMHPQCQEALLVNLRRSEIETVSAVPRQELLNLARAKLALRNACGHKTAPRNHPTRQGQDDTHVAVSQIRSDTKQVGEIGAVAFTLDGDVLGTYHHVVPGVEEAPEAKGPRSDASRCCWWFQRAKLSVVNTELLQRRQGRVQEDFQKWTDFISSERSFVFWDKDDGADLKLRELGKAAVHLPSALAAWPSGSPSSSDTSDPALQMCVERVLGCDWPYEPHRAFEDAVAIAALHVVLSTRHTIGTDRERS